MQEVTNSTGALGRAFAAVSNTIKVRFDQAFSGMQSLMVDFGKTIAETVLPMLEKLVKRLGELFNWFNSLTEAQKRHKIEFLLWAAALGPVLLLISALRYVLTGLLSAVSFVTEAFVGLQAVALANPWILVAAGIGLTVGWLIHLKNKSIEAQDAQSALNTTLIEVNGSLKKMKDLTSIDYSAMPIQTLYATREKTLKGLEDVNKNIANAYKMAGATEEQAAKGQHAGRWKTYIDDQIKQGLQLKNVYDLINAAINNWADSFGKATSSTGMDDVAATASGVSKAWTDLAEGMVYINRMMAISGGTFDEASAKLKLYEDVIEKLAKSDIPLTDSAFKSLLADFNRMGGTFDEQGKIARKFAEDLKYIDTLEKASRGGTKFKFDADQARLEEYKNTLEDVIKAIKTTEGYNAVAKQIDDLTNKIEVYQNLVDDAASMRQLRSLYATQEAFGGIDAQIEVLNYELRRAEKELNVIGENEGFSKRFQQGAESVKYLREELFKLKNQKELQFFEDMNNALHTAKTESDLLSARITYLQNELKHLSESGLGATDQFKLIAKEMQKMTVVQTVVDDLSSAFDELFTSIWMVVKICSRH